MSIAVDRLYVDLADAIELLISVDGLLRLPGYRLRPAASAVKTAQRSLRQAVLEILAELEASEQEATP